jgi:hypothetical protein
MPQLDDMLKAFMEDEGIVLDQQFREVKELRSA